MSWRVMEAAALHWEDVDWQERIIVFRRTIDRRGRIGPTKTRDEKEKPLPEHIRDLLLRIRAQRDPAPIAGPVFIAPGGRRKNGTYGGDYLRGIWKQACTDAGIKPIDLKNATRHSWGKQRLRRGFSLPEVSEAYGHSSVSMTRIYTGRDAEPLRPLFEKEK